MKRYAFISLENSVVQVIVGALGATQVERLLADYRILFGADSVVEVTDAAASVWISGSYNPESGTFAPPPSPEPEQLVEEIVNDDAPIE
jgi:hypothetical protein